MDAEIQGGALSGKLKQDRRRRIVRIFLFILLLFALGYGAFYLYQKRVWLKSRLDIAKYSALNQAAFNESALNENPKPLQDAFVADIENDVNDKFTKSDAYFITHRYFDNGGNVYEIYDYVNSHPSLAFLKEAEDIYPTIFDQIKNKTLTPIPYSPQSLYAVLAYLEVLDNHGYADIAALGTLANQYAKTAYFTKKKAETVPGGSAPSTPSFGDSVVKTAAEKAIFFALKTKDILNGMSRGGTSLVDIIRRQPITLDPQRVSNNRVLPHDLLVGLNQYAASLRYLDAIGIDSSSVIGSPVTADEIFGYNMVLARDVVPRLENFTSLLNASTLSLVSSDAVAIKRALQPILDFDVTQPTGIINYLVKAKDDKYGGRDIYGKINLVNLARIVPEFKAWLLRGGWRETDFS